MYALGYRITVGSYCRITAVLQHMLAVSCCGHSRMLLRATHTHSEWSPHKLLQLQCTRPPTVESAHPTTAVHTQYWGRVHTHPLAVGPAPVVFLHVIWEAQRS